VGVADSQEEGGNKGYEGGKCSTRISGKLQLLALEVARVNNQGNLASEGASCLVGARNAACGREGKGDTRTDADKVCCEKFLNREYTLIHVCCDIEGH